MITSIDELLMYVSKYNLFIAYSSNDDSLSDCIGYIDNKTFWLVGDTVYYTYNRDNK
jgi:signal peptidase I